MREKLLLVLSKSLLLEIGIVQGRQAPIMIFALDKQNYTLVLR